MAIQVHHKKPLCNRVSFRLSDEHLAQYKQRGGVLYIRALIDADMGKKVRRNKTKRAEK